MRTAAYGAWRGAVRAADLVAGSRRIGELKVDGENLYWLEGRPEESGRQIVMRLGPDGKMTEMTPRSVNVRTRVHEYGGGSYLVADGTLWFSNFADQRLYRLSPGGKPEPLTPEGLRYADGIRDRAHRRIICVREDHRQPGEPANSLVAIAPGLPAEGEVLFGGSHFVSSPSLSPDGRRLAFITWDHPNMPWDTTRLHVAELTEDGHLSADRVINPQTDEAVMAPLWFADGRLLVISDRTNGWWNFHRLEGNDLVPVTNEAFELGAAPWAFTRGLNAALTDGRILSIANDAGVGGLAVVDPSGGTGRLLDLPIVGAGSLAVRDGAAYFVAAFADRPAALVALDLATNQLSDVRTTTDFRLGAEHVSRAEAVAYLSGGDTAHGFYYPPTNPEFTAPEGTQPPLLVHVHGGPTGNTTPAFSLGTQFWTGRGFAVLDLNYRGSTGFGRDYRHRLYGNWGIFDVEDAVNGARSLAERGLADKRKLLISGGSAGGFTVLACHAFHDTFASGACFYGVSDLEALAKETHKFEARYLDQLIAPYPAGKDIYVARSPIHHLADLKKPLLILQGLEDRIVPPNQSEMIVEALHRNGVPVAYIAFAGEQHGFRKAENIITALEAELYFYGRVLGFQPADGIAPVEIQNAHRLQQG